MIARAAAALLGLLAGAMLLIATVLVPFWRGAPAAEFRGWFTAHAPRIRRVMVTLGAVATATTAAALVVTPAARGRLALATLGILGVDAVTVAVNEPANSRLVAPDVTDGETRALLDRWRRWHWVRVVLGLVALGGALAAIR